MKKITLFLLMIEILNGKRAVSRKIAARIVSQLALAPDEAKTILDLFPLKGNEQESSGRIPRAIAQKSIQLSIDEFKLVSDWYHFAILSALDIDGAKNTVESIARKLKLNLEVARDGLTRLERLGMVKIKRGKVHSTGEFYSTSDEVVNYSLRKVHAQHLEFARKSLEENSVEVRDFNAITMAINPDQIQSAKKLIRKFRDRLCTHLEKGKKKEVYTFSMQLIPLSALGEES
jgi:uncharacterized protein (TIGR02147 family)